MNQATLNLTTIKELPVYEIPEGCKVSNTEGFGSFLDAPGFPSYYLRHVLDVDGKSNTAVIEADGEWRALITEDSKQEDSTGLLALYWNPLNMDDERVKSWIDACYWFYREPKWTNESDPNDHKAVKYIQKFYPEYTAEMEKIVEPQEVYILTDFS